ncbi:MAG: FapA family protein [Treponema sp.]|jgi:uncharacterized protein (DUF342 family)|nr:FapA family protein [Treponema sp.]
MVDFAQLRLVLKDRLEQDRNIHSINAEGPTLEAAVAQAAALLNLPVRRIEYEVTQWGFGGILGAGKKGWKIRAYERTQVKKQDPAAVQTEETEEVKAPVIADKDGDVFVQLSQDGAFLKVIPPSGKGKRATEAMALKALEDKNARDIDRQVVSAAVKEADGSYVLAGQFDHNLMHDAFVSVELSDQEMKAFIQISPPGIGGCDISYETFISVLRNNKVVHGIKEEFLREFADRPVYKEKVLVAEGTKPVNGRDACMQYNFETDQSQVRLREGANGKVDFKDLNIIQNVVEGQPLAKKIPPEEGVMGRTITGKAIPAKNGKDISLPLGKNVHVGDDGGTIVADMNGQVVEVGGKINVEPVYMVQGNVDLKTGNIIFLGTVVITGNVEDGFSVKAAGNIEVNGTVEKAELDAEGDVIVHQGITGKNAGSVKAGKSIWARFIENATIEAGNMVVASDGIINSQVDAFKRIICQGKRAHIVGGRLRATEEINAKIIGSPTSGTETICEVGFDPKSKSQLDLLIANKEASEKELEDIQLNIQTLVTIKKQRMSLPEDKEAYLKELMDRRQELVSELQNINEEREKIQVFLSGLQSRGRVSASAKVYPGVKIVVKDCKEDIRNEYKAVTFVLENGLIRSVKYEEPDEEAKRGPDGYTTT